MEAFVEEVESGPQTKAAVATASAQWIEAWDAVGTEGSSSAPIRRQAKTWSINDFASRSHSGKLS